MQASEGRLNNGKPFVMDLALRTTSPVVAADQYTSALLAGTPGMTRLVWQRAGHPSMKAWAADRQAEAAAFRRAALLVAGQSHHRRLLAKR